MENLPDISSLAQEVAKQKADISRMEERIMIFYNMLKELSGTDYDQITDLYQKHFGISLQTRGRITFSEQLARRRLINM